ncbi:HNH endonuclease family protein [Mumia sp. zg.B53]|uniref:HNH endonuclease family protein n=1 Tax=unclassified Mumia TaxID=2621872 RepID=UPI001C6EE483|nr:MULTISPECIES: HNH endonuclease family protein [unclassified Mumia]MBW9209972.1 HNH endonuclease family protein [Mumia sp. zg.B21]MBW9214576.1 HNH endonuclease family protein [Mumia sp. zg.B53]
MTSRTARRLLAAAAALLVLPACGPVEVETGTEQAAQAVTTTAAPPAGKPAEQVADQVTKARAMLGRLQVAGRAPKTGYDRVGRFGQAWADVTRSGCGTRDNILSRDLQDVSKRNKCVVVGGRLADPYTGTTITFRKEDASAVQIDHVVPLSLGWQLGAQQWPVGKRVTFANDPINLMAVDGPTNSSKSDSGPDAWLPPNKAYRCTYVVRFTRVAAAYEMRVTQPMKDAISRILDGCTRVDGTPADLKPLPTSTWAYAAKFAGGTAGDAGAPTSAAPPAAKGPSVAPTGKSCPAKAPIKGNVPDGGGARIFHEPGSRSYAVTVPEACFATAADAQAAGFRAPR